jgi:hypothetical protein
LLPAKMIHSYPGMKSNPKLSWIGYVIPHCL